MEERGPQVAGAHGRAASNADEARVALATGATVGMTTGAGNSDARARIAATFARHAQEKAAAKRASTGGATKTKKKQSHMEDIREFDAEARALQAKAQTEEQKRKAFKREVDDKRLRNARFFMNIAHRMTVGRTDIRFHLCVTPECLLSVKSWGKD